MLRLKLVEAGEDTARITTVRGRGYRYETVMPRPAASSARVVRRIHHQPGRLAQRTARAEPHLPPAPATTPVSERGRAAARPRSGRRTARRCR
ncbi:hypothetical protein [Dactylosporangium sp. CA-233914]|uniref:hypothetical protein n=1 Tax=Dactylosporangium sp. CA-233914 TaxID=3239934 RepID=UPI003D8CD9DB